MRISTIEILKYKLKLILYLIDINIQMNFLKLLRKILLQKALWSVKILLICLE